MILLISALVNLRVRTSGYCPVVLGAYKWSLDRTQNVRPSDILNIFLPHTPYEGYVPKVVYGGNLGRCGGYITDIL